MSGRVPRFPALLEARGTNADASAGPRNKKAASVATPDIGSKRSRRQAWVRPNPIDPGAGDERAEASHIRIPDGQPPLPRDGVVQQIKIESGIWTVLLSLEGEPCRTRHREQGIHRLPFDLWLRAVIRCLYSGSLSPEIARHS